MLSSLGVASFRDKVITTKTGILSVKNYVQVSKEAFEVKLVDLNLPVANWVSSQQTVFDAVQLMKQKRLSAVLIAKEQFNGRPEELLGIFTERDLAKNFSLEMLDLKMEQFVTGATVTLLSDATLAESCQVMSLKEFRHLPIFHQEEGKFYLLTPKQILDYLSRLFPQDIVSHGTKVQWDLLEVNAQDEGMNFCPSEEAFSGSLFYYPLKKAIYHQASDVDVGLTLHQAIERLQQDRSGALVVTEFRGIIRGVFTESDLIKLICTPGVVENFSSISQKKIADFMMKDPHTLLEKHMLSFALNNMREFGYRRIIVVNEDRYPLSVVTQLDLLRFFSYQLFSK